jgi:hypothetical protein
MPYPINVVNARNEILTRRVLIGRNFSNRLNAEFPGLAAFAGFGAGLAGIEA